MFFADPVRAFANIARALRPGGRLVVVCWAEALDNDWLTVPGAAMAKHVALPITGEPDAPGPFSLASPDRVPSILATAGLLEVGIEELRVPMVFGANITETVEFMKATGFAQRLLAGADGPTVARVTEEMGLALQPYRTVDGISMGSKSWLVTASRAE